MSLHACCSASRHSLTVYAAREGRGGSSAGRAPTPKSFTPPERLLSPDVGKAVEGQPPARAPTVYTLRLSTGMKRGAGLSDPSAGLLVCMVAKDGSAVLRRLAPLTDPADAEQELRNICSSVDDGSGANCEVALDAAARSSAGRGGAAAAAPKRRFQQGAVDEVSFAGPELGPLAALMVAPEVGSWLCEEVDVSSSRTGHTDRFVCREALGERGDRPAAYLTPVPPGAVVYGSGDATMVLSQEQAAQLRAFSMRQYADLKGQLLLATAILVSMGSGVAFAAGGTHLALPFALGGSSGMLYSWLLQQGVDGALGGAGGEARVQPGPALSLQVALANPASRLALVCAGMAGSLVAANALTQQGTAAQPVEVNQIAAALAGSLCYKAALLGVGVMPAAEQPFLADSARDRVE